MYKRQIKIRALVANPKRILKAEMLATAHFEMNFKSGVLVPASSVLLTGTRHTVFVQAKPGEFEPRLVELAYEGPRDVVISSGLQVGEQVVAENVLLLARQFQLVQEEARSSAKASHESSTEVSSAQPTNGGTYAK